MCRNGLSCYVGRETLLEYLQKSLANYANICDGKYSSHHLHEWLCVNVHRFEYEEADDFEKLRYGDSHYTIFCQHIVRDIFGGDSDLDEYIDVFVSLGYTGKTLISFTQLVVM